MIRRSALLALALGVLGVALGASPASTQPAGRPEPVRRLLVISVPGLTWADVEDHDLPHLERFFDGAALADLAPRGVSPRSGPGDAYLTISAGARATTERTIDGQVLALDEQSSGSAAGDIFARRTGISPDGDYVSLAWPALVRRNDSQPYDAVLGLLATTLDEAGVSLAAIGNADGTDSVGASYERQVGLAAADEDGVVADGALGEDLSVQDPTRPFGRRVDLDQVVAALRSRWADGADRQVVVVEASDLARTMRYRTMVGPARYRELWADALAEADELVGRLLDEVDDERDAVMVVAPYNLVGDRDLTAVALRGPGVEPGYLRSASTQRAGFLTLVDIAPTILDRLDIERPVEMEGRPAEVTSSERSVPDRVEHLVALNAASRFRERLLVPTTTAAVVVLALVLAAAVALHVGGRDPRWRGLLRFTALADLALLPWSYLARGFPLEDLGAGFYWAFVVVGAVASAAAAVALGRATSRPRLPLILVLSFMALVLVGDVTTGSRLSLSAAFGYSPTGNSRLYGISNYSYGQLATAACLLGALLAGRGRLPRARPAAVGLLVATLVVLGVPKWGSDVGGVLAFTPAILVFAVVLWHWRIRVRTVVASVVATAVAITAFGFLDLARPPEERAHLGRLFERVGDEGLGPLFSIMERKLLANLRVSTSSLWVAAIPIALAFWLYLVRGPGRPIQALRHRLPTLGAGLAAAFVAAVLGSLVNDSGAIVGGVASLVLSASLLVLLLEPVPADPAPVSGGAGP
ncbi:MAG TPA: hypothetical protein VFV32_11885 [Acidimicrobiales bacterium]|nr:hypothetical protein [Acidimicrobiales bacterium]